MVKISVVTNKQNSSFTIIVIDADDVQNHEREACAGASIVVIISGTVCHWRFEEQPTSQRYYALDSASIKHSVVNKSKLL